MILRIMLLIGIVGSALLAPGTPKLGIPGDVPSAPSFIEPFDFSPLARFRLPLVGPVRRRIREQPQQQHFASRTVSLGTHWVRMNDRISWRELQPVAGGPIQWGLLAEFENELRSMKSSGLTPVVIVVDDYPHWAVDPAARQDRQPTSCGRLLPDQYPAFAAFVHEIVSRYRSAEFNVHHWELGNEPDVDPDLVSPDSIFGCWGEISDREYYGGKEYGNMLKVVYPAIKSADPAAVVWLGGLLLDRPLTSDPALGHPENFIKGVLASGAGSAVDIIPYHAYAFFSNQMIDPDNGGGSPWTASGGIFLGKVRYLRHILAQYGVDKPLVINETALLCSGGTSCSPPVPAFYEMQADYLVRAFTRGLSENILGYSWYTLEGEGWRYSGLLHSDGSPKPVYTAYQVLYREASRIALPPPGRLWTRHRRLRLPERTC